MLSSTRFRPRTERSLSRSGKFPIFRDFEKYESLFWLDILVFLKFKHFFGNCGEPFELFVQLTHIVAESCRR